MGSTEIISGNLLEVEEWTWFLIMVSRSAGAVLVDNTMMVLAGRCAWRIEASGVVRGLQTKIEISAAHIVGSSKICESLRSSLEGDDLNSVISTGIGNWVKYPDDTWREDALGVNWFRVNMN